jgi:hypothetical protein
MRVLQFVDELPPPGPRPSAPLVLHLPAGLTERTQEELAVASEKRREAIVLWAGRSTVDGAALITHLLMPTFESDFDRLVIPPRVRHELALWLRRERLLVFADLHDHPHEAFLSEADVVAPFSSKDGFYAVVIPSFATGEPLRGWRTYEAIGGHWHERAIGSRFRELPV